MALAWDGLHCTAGIFKLNVHKSFGDSEALKDEWIWEASTPGHCHDSNRLGPYAETERAAKDQAEAWLLMRAAEILSALNIPPEQPVRVIMRLTALGGV